MASAASSGQPTMSPSTSGNRSGAAKLARPPTTTTSYPGGRASATNPRATAARDGHGAGAAAGERDAPRVLVPVPVANHGGVPRPGGRLDLRGGGASDEPAAHRAGNPAVARQQEDRALRPGRRAEGPNHD